jgi:2-dehydropantoate 2-reductase
MKVLIIGAGAIGLIYGYLLSKSGNQVCHYVRKSRYDKLKDGINVELLDARDEKKPRLIEDLYKIDLRTDFNGTLDYDFILVSMKHGSLDSILKSLRDNNVKNTIVFFNGIWRDVSYVNDFISSDQYLWGYPVAGGNMNYETNLLKAAVLDHVILNEINDTRTKRLESISNMFKEASIKVENPANIIHWIWIHMAINAGVISTCLKYGCASEFMDSLDGLKEGILTIRETLKVAEARGVNLRQFSGEISSFKIPTFISTRIMKKLFKKNIPVRQIMELHNNLDDLFELCTDVYQSVFEYKIKAPLFTEKSKYFLNRSTTNSSN